MRPNVCNSAAGPAEAAADHPAGIHPAAAEALRPRQQQLRVMWPPGAQRPSAGSTAEACRSGNLTAETFRALAAGAQPHMPSFRLRPAAWPFRIPIAAESRSSRGLRGRS